MPLPDPATQPRRGRLLLAAVAALGLLAVAAAAAAVALNGATPAAHVASAARATSATGEAKPVDWFAAQTYQGSGDQTITLPDGIEYGIVTASYTGDEGGVDMFVLSVFDGDGAIDDVLVSTYLGDYEGVTALGLHEPITGPVRVEVQSWGDWEIAIAHPSAAPLLEAPASGTGDSVWRYTGGADTWEVKHTNSVLHFSLRVVGPPLTILANGMGYVKETVRITDDVEMVIIKSSGKWTITPHRR